MWSPSYLARVCILAVAMFGPAGCGSSPSTGAWAMPRLAPATQPTRVTSQSDSTRDPRQRAVPGDLPEMGIPTSDAWWRDNEVEAYQEAASRDLGLLVDFTAVWCLPCVALDQDVFGDPRVRAEIDADFVPLKIDVSEETRANKDQLLRYRVNRLPAVIMLDAQGRELGRISHYTDIRTARARIAEARYALSQRRHLRDQRAARPAP